MTAVVRLHGLGGLDASRIYVRGESYGGLIALATALQEPHRVKAVIAEYPLVSVRGYLSQSFIDEFSITEYGDPKNEELMKKLDELCSAEQYQNVGIRHHCF